MLYLLITMRQIIDNYLCYSARHSAQSDNKQTGGGKGEWMVLPVVASYYNKVCSKSRSAKNCVFYLFNSKPRLDQKFNNCTLMYHIIYQLPSTIQHSSPCRNFDKYLGQIPLSYLVFLMERSELTTLGNAMILLVRGKNAICLKRRLSI